MTLGLINHFLSQSENSHIGQSWINNTNITEKIWLLGGIWLGVEICLQWLASCAILHLRWIVKLLRLGASWNDPSDCFHLTMYIHTTFSTSKSRAHWGNYREDKDYNLPQPKWHKEETATVSSLSTSTGVTSQAQSCRPATRMWSSLYHLFSPL